jgi:hypothetical protein
MPVPPLKARAQLDAKSDAKPDAPKAAYDAAKTEVAAA